MGMLLCLDREQRLAFVLGTIFEASDVVAAEVLGISRDAFRQQLCRAREQLTGYVRRVRELSTVGPQTLAAAAEQACEVLYREHPFYDPPKVAAQLRELLEQAPVRASLNLTARTPS